MTGRRVLSLGVVLLAGWVTGLQMAVSAQPRPSQAEREAWNAYLPPGEAKTLVATKCTACHNLKGTVQLRQDKDAWEALVIDMVSRGAPLTVEEADQIIPYLATVFGPTAPRLTDVNAAPAEELVKLPGVTKEAADKLVAHRTANGRISSRDQAQAILGLDAPTFEKVKWYLQAGEK